MNRWIRDLLYAVRTLRRAPAYSVAAVLLLALGVGAVTTIFTLFDNILLRPLPYPAEDRLVVIEDASHSGPFWNAIQDNGQVDSWAAAWTKTGNLTGQGEPRGIEVGQVSEHFFEVFGASAIEGRLLAPDDFTGADRVALSYSFWQQALGADPAVVGSTIDLDGRAHQVVGVVSRSFAPPEAISGAEVDLWRPLDWSMPSWQEHGFHVLGIAGRMKEGASVESVQAELQAVVTRFDAEFTDRHYRDREGNLWQVPVAQMREVTVRGVQGGLRLLLGAVGLLLLVACSNVAHLAVARGLSRTSEMSLRRALGANTTSLVRQLFVESLVIAVAGGVLGVGMAALAVKSFLALAPTALPRGQDLAVDLRVVGFAALISSLTALVFGLLPAVRMVGSLRSSKNRSSTEDRGSGLLRGGLVVIEVALSLMLLIGAGVLIRSFSAVSHQDTGVRSDGLWRIPLKPTGVDEPEQYIAEMTSLREALAAVPGVEAVSNGLSLPFTFVGGHHCCWGQRLHTPEQPEGGPVLTMHPVGPDYFSTLGIPISLGAVWGPADVNAPLVPAILPQSTASELFGSPESALGQTLDVGNELQLTVVAIAGDNRHFGLDQAMRPAVYLPMEKLPFGLDFAEFAVRTTPRAPDNFANSLRQAIWSVAPDLPVPTVEPFENRISQSTASRRFDSILFGSFGAIALLLAAAGLYGTLLYTVSQRRREMGIRMALGAQRRHVESRVLRSGAVVSGLGILLGLAGAWVATRALESRIWGIEARDPYSLIGATLLLIVVALLASWLPARKAGRTDPMEALRAE